MSLRVGILTFHSQSSYGGVLQAIALQNFLLRLGCDVKVIDRWMMPKNECLNGILVVKSFKAWFCFLVRAVMCFGDVRNLIRCFKTKSFIRRHLRLTGYSFYDWNEAPKDLGVDLIVVGSDQVWGRHFWDPHPYLLIGAPEIPAISYAASMGMHAIPFDLVPVFKTGIPKFSAISVREREAGSLVAPYSDKRIQHVVDPTLLIDRSFWDQCADRVERRIGSESKKKLVCYLLHTELQGCVKALESFGRKMDCEVVFLAGSPCRLMPRKLLPLLEACCLPIKMLFSSIRYRPMIMPDEFVSEIRSADWVITDSFHGLMFSLIYQKDVRILRPASLMSSNMSARISEVVEDFIVGNPFACTIHAAVDSLCRGPSVSYSTKEIELRRLSSAEWLREALESAPRE